MAIAGQRPPNRSTGCFLFTTSAIVAGAAAVAAIAQPLHAQQLPVLPPVQVIAPSPLIGSGIDRNSVPAATHVFDYRDIERRGVPDLLWSLNQEVGGVTLDSASGNPFQPTFNYQPHLCRADHRASPSTSTACASTNPSATQWIGT